MTTRDRPRHLRDLVTGTSRAATDSPGLHRGCPLVEHHPPSFAANCPARADRSGRLPLSLCFVSRTSAAVAG